MASDGTRFTVAQCDGACDAPRCFVRRYRQWIGTGSGIEAAAVKTSFLALMWASLLWGDAGVLLPGDKKQPDPAILSLEEMSIDIRIDNGHARTSIRQIYLSHAAGVLEGSYLFALPGRALVSDFAVWDDVTRI